MRPDFVVAMGERALAALLIVALVVLGMPSPAGAQVSVVAYVAPVGTAVVDPFRPPAHVGAPGNRGLEYDATEGLVVGAAADGIVAFAGPIGDNLYISIDHPDGLRTTYSNLGEVFVSTGAAVRQHLGIAVAGPGLHFGVVAGDHYLDPQVLLDASMVSGPSRLVAAPSD